MSTIRKVTAAVNAVHKAGGHPAPGDDPRMKMVMRGIVREVGVAPRNQKSPLLTTHVQDMVRHLPGDIRGIRDRALLLLTFSGALRKSEVINLTGEDIAIVDEGLRVRIRRSKTDQTGTGVTIGLARGTRRSTCVVYALEAWLSAARLTEGPLFRRVTRHCHVGPNPLSPGGFSKIIKDALESAGLDVERYSPHSLRAGFATQAAMAGVEERLIARQTRHRSIIVLRTYIREADLFRQNPSSELGL